MNTMEKVRLSFMSNLPKTEKSNSWKKVRKGYSKLETAKPESKA
jgi:hypothetical protein